MHLLKGIAGTVEALRQPSCIISTFLLLTKEQSQVLRLFAPCKAASCEPLQLLHYLPPS